MFFQPLEQFEIYTTEYSAIFHILKLFIASYGVILIYIYTEMDLINFFNKCKYAFEFFYVKSFNVVNNDRIDVFNRINFLYLDKIKTSANAIKRSSIFERIHNDILYIAVYSYKAYEIIVCCIYVIAVSIFLWSVYQLTILMFNVEYFDFLIMPILFPHITNFELLLILAYVWYYIIFVWSKEHWVESFYHADYLLPTKRQMFIESIYIFLITLLVEQAGLHAQKYFTMICSIFIMILLFNCLGLIPCSFAFTSHIVVTFTFGFSVLVFLIGLGLWEFQYVFFTNFLPKDIHISLLPLLFFIELVSFLSRGLSLSIRLFANIMSGHTLLNILSGFLGILLGLGTFSQIGSLCLVFVILVICVLEFSLAFIQAYVFTVLTCIYLKDSLHLHNYDLISAVKQEHNYAIKDSKVMLYKESMFRPVTREEPYYINDERRCHVSLYNKQLVFRYE